MESLPVLAVLLILVAAAAPGLYALRRRMAAGGELEIWSVLRRRGLSRADTEGDPRALAIAVRRCTLCPASDACRDWLASGRPAPFRELCPNAAYLEKLEGR
jgi:hypothetical protein